MASVLFLLAMAAAQPALPRCLIMISEQNVGQSAAKYWWGGNSFSADFEVAENTIADVLRSAGYTVVDRKLLQGRVQATPAISSPDPSDKAIKEFAIATGAELVFVGKAIAVDSPSLDPKLRVLKGTISMRALNLDDARILAATSSTQNALNVDGFIGGSSAIKKAASKAMEEMLPKITDELRAKKMTVKLTLKGLKNFKQLRALETELRQIADVLNVTERSFANRTAELEVEFAGPASALATRLDETKLKVIAATPNTVTAELE